ncbi:hypothetical protein WJX79_004917 [Trebouxia sp. C0005]
MRLQSEVCAPEGEGISMPPWPSSVRQPCVPLTQLLHRCSRAASTQQSFQLLVVQSLFLPEPTISDQLRLQLAGNRAARCVLDDSDTCPYSATSQLDATRSDMQVTS